MQPEPPTGGAGRRLWASYELLYAVCAAFKGSTFPLDGDHNAKICVPDGVNINFDVHGGQITKDGYQKKVFRPGTSATDIIRAVTEVLKS